jgi:phosphatidylserine/phosphatidylglycerophosphate/cardiolipin synthase-like enzyme
MKPKTWLPIILILLLFLPGLEAAAQPPEKPKISVYFSPNGGCTQAILAEIANAKASILMQAYIFQSAGIAKALVAAHKKGVKVEIILDRRQRKETYGIADFLANSGIPTRIDSVHAYAHNKVMVIDEETVITGSFNFTKSAEDKNAENLLVIKDKGIAMKYVENWKEHAKHSPLHKGRQIQGQTK